MILLIVIITASALADQGTKWLATLLLKDAGTVPVIPRVLEWTYLTNEGVAGGAFAGNFVATLLLPIIGLVALGVYLFRFSPKEKRYRIPMAFVLGGGLGNLIDRIFRGDVVDFISMPWLPWVQWKPFRFVDFPIFNVADIFVTLGAIALIAVLVVDLVKEAKTAKKTAAEGKSEATAPKDGGNHEE